MSVPLPSAVLAITQRVNSTMPSCSKSSATCRAIWARCSGAAMLDRIDEVQTIDVREELKDRFIGTYWFYLEGMEFRPGFRLTKREAALAAVFETLHDSVDAIPVELIVSTEQICAGLTPIEFEKLLTDQL